MAAAEHVRRGRQLLLFQRALLLCRPMGGPPRVVRLKTRDSIQAMCDASSGLSVSRFCAHRESIIPFGCIASAPTR